MDRNNAIFDHWLAGETTTEIAEKLHITRQSIDNVIESAKTAKREAMLHTEQPPISNVWNYASCDPRFGQKHPGQMTEPVSANAETQTVKGKDDRLFSWVSR